MVKKMACSDSVYKLLRRVDKRHSGSFSANVVLYVENKMTAIYERSFPTEDLPRFLIFLIEAKLYFRKNFECPLFSLALTASCVLPRATYKPKGCEFEVFIENEESFLHGARQTIKKLTLSSTPLVLHLFLISTLIL